MISLRDPGKAGIAFFAFRAFMAFRDFMAKRASMRFFARACFSWASARCFSATIRRFRGDKQEKALAMLLKTS